MILLEKVLDRGEKVEVLVENSEELKKNSNIYLTNSKKVKKKMEQSNIRLWIIGGIIVFVCFIIILFIFYFVDYHISYCFCSYKFF